MNLNPITEKAHSLYQKMYEELSRREKKLLLRTLQEPQGIDFCSNDYLGLSKDPRLMAAMQEGIRLYGLGSTASRLIRGHRDIVQAWEEKIAQFAGGSAALHVANGFTANLGLLDALADKQTIVFTDRLNHASILDGIRLSGAKRVYYKHLDLADLQFQLNKYRSHPKKILVSETVFSMDGDVLPLRDYMEIAKEHNCLVILDETHAFGVFGENGKGVSAGEDVDFKVYTLGKALGLEGGVIICKNSISKDYLVNCMRNFVFSTAPMPATAYAAIQALDLLIQEPERIQRIWENGNYFIQNLQNTIQHKFDSLAQEILSTIPSKLQSQIIPILFSSEEQAIQASLYLQEKGLDVRAIRPPTVPTPRLRISIHADHTKEDLDKLIQALTEFYFSPI